MVNFKRISCISFVLLLISFSCVSCDKESSSSSSIQTNFYNEHDFKITDPEANKINVFVIIYSQTCSHCQDAEDKIENIANNELKDYTFVTVTSDQVNHYSLPMEYKETVDFYYGQGSDYVDPAFSSGYLYQFDIFPTPTAMFLSENRELNHVIFGFGSTQNDIKNDLVSLLDTVEESI